MKSPLAKITIKQCSVTSSEHRHTHAARCTALGVVDWSNLFGVHSNHYKHCEGST